MQQIISQVALPIILASIMLGMGLSLQSRDFKSVLSKPRAVILGLILQITLLPVLALVIIKLLPLSATAAAGLFLLSLCPGGATSNLFSFIARGNIALSVSLTGVVSILSPFILPLMFILFLEYNGAANTAGFHLPLAETIQKLVLVTLLPLTIGMLIRYQAPNWAQSIVPLVKKISTVAMIIIILALMATNLPVIPAMLSINGVAALLLCTSSLLLTYRLAGWLRIDDANKRTISLEVGVQNAGTAMMVALSIMQQPELAIVPLIYGLLMNIPAFGFVVWLHTHDKAKNQDFRADIAR